MAEDALPQRRKETNYEENYCTPARTRDVYNNKDDAVNMVAYEGGHIPHVFISKDAGAALAAASDKHAFVGSEM